MKIDQTIKDKMDVMCITRGERRDILGIHEMDCLFVDLGIDGTKALKWILKKYMCGIN
jgi:hypothetical protein